jgi:predicted esterase YcpF (UPF0227 family)
MGAYSNFTLSYTMSTTHLLYLHGFRSSPQSTKAQLVQQQFALHHPHVQVWCPQLPPSPRLAIELLQQGIADWPHERMAVVGSSLGGFYATWIAETTGCRAAVLNPAVHPARDLAQHIGQVGSWHDPQDQFFFKAEYIGELQALTRSTITHPERYYALIAKGDELLDWREMSAHYKGSAGCLLAGSNHAITEFAEYLDEVVNFLL